MSADAPIAVEAALLAAYGEWRKLAELEGEAISKRDWNIVKDCQARLAALQPGINRLAGQVRDAWRQLGIRAEKEENLRRIISGLIELESKNNSLLTSAKESARQNLDQLESSRQNLKRVQRSYSMSHPARLNSLS